MGYKLSTPPKGRFAKLFLTKEQLSSYIGSLCTLHKESLKFSIKQIKTRLNQWVPLSHGGSGFLFVSHEEFVKRVPRANMHAIDSLL